MPGRNGRMCGYCSRPWAGARAGVCACAGVYLRTIHPVRGVRPRGMSAPGWAMVVVCCPHAWQGAFLFFFSLDLVTLCPKKEGGYPQKTGPRGYLRGIGYIYVHDRVRPYARVS